jgi:hypothetical protein
MVREIRPLFLIAFALVASLLGAVSDARAQCADPAGACNLARESLFLGDLNNDQRVNADDVDFWAACIRDNLAASGVYCQWGDFNYDGLIDQNDLNYLERLVQMAANPAIGKLPRTIISEVRVAKPASQTNPAIPQSRYVEIRTPLNAPAGAFPTIDLPNPADPTNSTRLYGEGWFYLKVARSTSATALYGTIGVVVDLEGMPWVNDPVNADFSSGLSLVTDSSFVPATPVPDAVPLNSRQWEFPLPPGGSLALPGTVGGITFPNEISTNVTHLIVYRAPDPANTRALPAVGQRVSGAFNDPDTQCALPWLVPGSGSLPPWDAIVDAMTLIRGEQVSSYGCIFADRGDKNELGPIGSGGTQVSPIHPYRCRSASNPVIANRMTNGLFTITAVSDTPFVRNPTCGTVQTGCGEFNPDGSTRNCFQAQPAGRGCTDADCCTTVCEVDPTCCAQVWDQQCADLADARCNQCGLTDASCLEPHDTAGCNDQTCCDLVCKFDPSCCSVRWDANCADLAAERCLACGKVVAGDCDEVHENPYCSNEACCETVCEISPDCCSVTWDQVCVNLASQRCSGCGSDSAGSCCIIHPTPYCNDGDCCEAVCERDPFCCENAWDLNCTLLAVTTPQCSDQRCVCRLPDPGEPPVSCFEEQREGGCGDPYCCQIICQRDPYCCFVAWDSVCVDGANQLCTINRACVLQPDGVLPVTGSCFVEHATPGCDRPGCCDAVCKIDPTCCDIEWSAECAKLAAQTCDSCGDLFSGSCFEPHGTPNCSDEACCQKVCALDPICCGKAWDDICVALANAQCDAPGDTCGESPRSCWVGSYWSSGCSQQACCEKICEFIDPYCCETRWDSVCAYQADELCTATFPTQIGREGCLDAHESPGCASAQCMRTVCSVSPRCCTDAWDQECATRAAGICVSPGSCPSDGDCFAAHQNPGCDDPSCCNATCIVDPICCNGEWDTNCVQIARQRCQQQSGEPWPCPCAGDCFSAHDNPGCDRGTCCTVVCNISPTCCENDWDQECVSLARLHCCGPVGCGSGCNKPCLELHAEPFCDDPNCCATVCAEDITCCEFAWDALCVEIAARRCAGSCGMQDAGTPFDFHETPGCNQPQCCGTICKLRPECCTIEWDNECVALAKDPQNADVCVLPQCGDETAGPPCRVHADPASTNATCCDAVCKIDPFCCDTTWDINCVDEARAIPDCGCGFTCGDPCAGSCCSAHDNGGCDDADCCDTVCKIDPFCCDNVWDGDCASTARQFCDGQDEACPAPTCGSDELPNCCVASPVPHCSNEACCTAVCALDSFCCETRWDANCVEQARKTPSCECEIGVCGDPASGSCFTEHLNPGCSDGGCCQFVCAADPDCCDDSWDSSCVKLATIFCGAPFEGVIEGLDPTGGVKPGRFRNPPSVPPTAMPLIPIREPVAPPPGVTVPARPKQPVPPRRRPAPATIAPVSAPAPGKPAALPANSSKVP